MTAKLLTLSTEAGLTPDSQRQWDDFAQEVWRAVDKAYDSNLPVAAIISELEAIKFQVLMNQFGPV